MASNNTDSKNEKNKLQAKVFSKRESLITELLEVKHFKILKHIFLAVLFGFISRDVVKAFSNDKDINFGFSLITRAFANFHLALACWTLLYGINLLTYKLFKCWALKRIELCPKSIYIKLWDTFFLLLVILYESISIFGFPFIQFTYLNLGIASSFAIQIENVRLVMKSHAFIRSNSPDVLNYKVHSDSKLIIPTFTNYLYFSVLPTLLYRKEYPRTDKVNFKKAMLYFGEVLCIIWLESYIFEICLLKPFSRIGKFDVNWYSVAVTVMENSIAGGLLMLVNFYLILHAWYNALAELLSFADRRFYEDWWTSTNYSTYFRSWNIVVYDWLYEYVYRDFYYYVVPKNKTFAKCMVFLVSALIHEVIVIFTLGHFLPIMFVFFCCGAMFASFRTTHPFCNIFVLYSLALGNAIQLSLHTIEYYARTNCPYPDTWNSSSFVPRFVTLDC